MAFTVNINDKGFRCLEIGEPTSTNIGGAPAYKFTLQQKNQQIDALAWIKFKGAGSYDYYPHEETQYVSSDESTERVPFAVKVTSALTNSASMQLTGGEDSERNEANVTASASQYDNDDYSGSSFIALVHFRYQDQDYVDVWNINCAGSEVEPIDTSGVAITYVPKNLTTITKYALHNFLGYTVTVWTGPAPPQIDDPYINGGYSKSDGGFGKQTEVGDNIFLPEVEEIFNLVGDGNFVRVFTPEPDELRNLHTFLLTYHWGNILNRYTTDPSHSLIALFMLPFAPSNTAEPDEILFAGIKTGVNAKRCLYRYETLDFGEMKIEPFYNAKWDYSPYTSAQIYLPYIGMKDVDIDELMGKTVRLTYRVDILTGACVASLLVGNDLRDDASILYQFNGNLASQIPLSSSDQSQLVQAFIQGATNIVAGTATGALGGGAVGGLAGAVAGAAVGAIGGMTNQLGNVLTAKPQIQRSGNLACNNGILGVQVPYFVFKIPRQNYAKDYGRQYGFPSNQYFTIGELHGFTQVKAVHLEEICATEDELNEIERLLKEGVLL